MSVLLRQFALPHPLYLQDSAWNQTARNVPLDPQNNKRVLATLNMLNNEGMGNYITVNYDEYTVPVYRGRRIKVRTYEGEVWEPRSSATITINGTLYYAGLAVPDSVVRAALPEGKDSDGHIVLFDVDNQEEHDYFQATTQLDDDGYSKGAGYIGPQIIEAGAVAMFKVNGLGAQITTNDRPFNSARATGVPLLAGLMVPEDLKAIIPSDLSTSEIPVIRHALALALPALRCVAHGCAPDQSSDWVYPASKTETMNATADPLALAGGERIRLTETLEFLNGTAVPEDNRVSCITRIFFRTLREYGAYIVDASGSVAFYAEEVTTANLCLEEDQMRWLIGRLPQNGETPWEAVMKTLSDDLEWKLSQTAGLIAEQPVPFAVVQSENVRGNFQVIAPATPPSMPTSE